MISRKQLRSALAFAIARQDRACQEATAIKAKLSENCMHEETFNTKEANDNGYGSWWYTHYRVCSYCGHRERIGTSPYTGASL